MRSVSYAIKDMRTEARMPFTLQLIRLAQRRRITKVQTGEGGPRGQRCWEVSKLEGSSAAAAERRNVCFLPFSHPASACALGETAAPLHAEACAEQVLYGVAGDCEAREGPAPPLPRAGRPLGTQGGPHRPWHVVPSSCHSGDDMRNQHPAQRSLRRTVKRKNICAAWSCVNSLTHTET